MKLPECFHRGGVLLNGNFGCSHPGILQKDGVSGGFCAKKCLPLGIYCNLPPAPHHLARKKPVPCQHRGAEITKVQCDTCAGKVMVKVFECKVFGQCTLAKPVLVNGNRSPVCEGCKHQLPPALPVRLDGNQNVE